MRTGKLIIAGLIIGFLSVAPAGLMAQAVWTNGTITKEPWKDKYTHISVNDVSYTLMPKGVRITRQYQVEPGMYGEEKVKAKNLRAGQKVMIRTQGHRIYQIHIIE